MFFINTVKFDFYAFQRKKTVSDYMKILIFLLQFIRIPVYDHVEKKA